jgi:pimeloyl-ACP methyl ester carboxylesterase
VTQPSFIRRDGIRLAYCDVGIGTPFLFQHGLGGDDKQVSDVFPDKPSARRITLECRGQGRSAYGPVSKLSLATFADDLASLYDHLNLDGPIVGGISMGAAIAMRSAILWPRRFRGLVLARPAWISQSAPLNMSPYAIVGDLLLRYHVDEARDRFLSNPTASLLQNQAPDNLSSLLGFFSRPQPRDFGALLKAIADDGPGVSEEQIGRIDVPTLVVGHRQDLAHPLAYAERLASLIPCAELRVIAPKAADREAYRREFRDSLSDFLDRWA